MTLPTRRHRHLAALVALLLLAGGALAVMANPSLLERDVVQERLDRAGAPLGPGHTLGQSFISGRAGLRRIEFLAVVYDPTREFPPEARVCLDLERLDEPSPPVTSCLPIAGIAHNQTLSFDIPPQADSRASPRGVPYRLMLRSDQDVGLSVWLTDHEAYAAGQAWEDGAPRAGDLYFRTFCDYRLTDALGDLAAGLGRRAWPIAAALVVLLVPGGTLLMLVPIGRRLEPVVALALAAALSLAFWPLLLLWATTLGLRLGPLGAWSAVALLALAAVARVAWIRHAGRRPASLRRAVTTGNENGTQIPQMERWWPQPRTPGRQRRSALYQRYLRTIGTPVQRLSERHSEEPRPLLCRALLRNRDPWPYVALAVVMLLVVGTRALQVRDLVVPAWVDSVHHTMITRLVAEGGRVPTTYRPYMPVDAFHYHFGFHAGAAALAWLSGLATDQAVLLFGQALNVLAPLAAYAMAWWIGRNRWGGVGAALVVGAVSYMPAYYVTWGRYTQLAGLDMFPPLALVTAWALGLRRGGARWGGMVLLAAALLAGLVLTHYRVLVFYAFLAIPQAAVILWRMARDPSPSPLPASGERASAPRMAPDSSSRLIASEARANTSPATPSSSSPLPIGGARADASPIGAGVMRALGRIIGRGALCGALALFLALPWVVGFLARVAPGFEATYGGWAGGEGGNEFPVALLNVGWTRPLLYVAAAGALWGLVRRRGEAIATAAWVGLCLLAANPRLLGLADTWLITNSAVVIAFWLPVGALCGWLVGDLGRLLARARLPRVGRVGGRVVSAVLLVAMVVLAAVGSWRMVDIVNPVTVLATEEDVSAMAWARDHTPPGALFLVNTGVWQGPMRYGTDAGWWLNLLADRSTTLPSLLYMMGGQAYFAEVNALGIAVEEAQSVDDPALLDRLRAAGVTHVFVGARGGRLLPRDLDPSPHYRALYTDGPIRIYEVVYP